MLRRFKIYSELEIAGLLMITENKQQFGTARVVEIEKMEDGTGMILLEVRSPIFEKAEKIYLMGSPRKVLAESI